MKTKDLILKLICEELQNITADEFVTDKYINDDILSSDDAERMFDEYKYNNDFDIKMDFDEFMENDDNAEDFKDWLTYEMKYRFDEKKDLFDKLFFTGGGGKITIFRAMKVSKKWLKSLMKPNAKLGIYWAYEKNAAEPHWGYNNKGRTETAVLQTSVTEDQVDWNKTFEANLHPSLGEQEKEIRLKEDAKIHLEVLLVNNNEINLNKTIKSNIYLA